MKLIFADNTEMEIKNIFGNPEYVQGFNRDVLTIEIDPKVADLNKIQEIFKDSSKTKVLTTKEVRKVQELVETEEIDEQTKEKKKEMKEVEKEITTQIGQWYTIYISSVNEVKEIKTVTGVPSENPTEEVNKVKIGQLTHTEMQLEMMKEFMAKQGFKM